MKALRPTNIPFPSTGSFTRASTATYIEDGILKTAAINEPRWQDGKLLLEGEGTNILSYSSTFDDATWFKSGLTISPNVIAAPDGTSTADLVTVTGANPVLYKQPNLVSNFYTLSVFAKAGVGSSLQIRIDSPSQVSATFNLDTGSIVAVSGGLTADISLIGNGWYRCSLSGTLAIVNTVFGCGSTIGNTVYLWGTQLEVGSNSSSYIPTVASSVTRSADTIAGTGLIYTNATDARPLWSNATTYSIGQVIRYNNTVYESLQNTNLNKQPDTNPTWWLSLGADNISAAFDGKVGSKTTSTDKLRMIIKPGTNIDSVGYIEATASTISTSAVDEDYNLVYSYKSGLDTSIIEDWYDYFFLDPLGDPLTQVVHQGISPLDPNLLIGVEMVRSGTVELGVFVTGQTTAIGKTQYGLRAGIVDYSKKEADEFGNITIVERPYSKRLEGDVYVNNYDLNKVQRFLYNVRATPILWIASDSEELAEVSNVYGFYKDFSTTIAYPDVSMCSLQIEGLV